MKSKKEKELTLIRHGNNDPVATVTRPKLWNYRRLCEERPRKEKRAKEIKLKEQAWNGTDMMNLLTEIRAGTNQCKWMITSYDPNRPVTPTDVLHILHAAYKMGKHNYEFDIRINESKHVLVFNTIQPFLPDESK